MSTVPGSGELFKNEIIEKYLNEVNTWKQKYEELLKKYELCCQNCGNLFTKMEERLDYEHCYKCDKKFLCNNCRHPIQIMGIFGTLYICYTCL